MKNLARLGGYAFWSESSLAQSFIYFAFQKLPEKYERFNIQELLK